MKLRGETFYRPFIKREYFPRGTAEETIMFEVQNVDFLDDFLKVCPEPEPPLLHVVGQDAPIPNMRDAKYLTKRAAWLNHFQDYGTIRCLKDVEWETVSLENPTTWENYKVELRELGLSDQEIGRLIIAAQTVQGVNPEAIKQAEQDFLAMERQQKQKSTFAVAPTSTESGDAVSDGD